MAKHIVGNTDLISDGLDKKIIIMHPSPFASIPPIEMEKWSSHSRNIINRIKSIFADEQPEAPFIYIAATEEQKNTDFFRKLADFNDENE